jgi:TPR repeat protein
MTKENNSFSDIQKLTISANAGDVDAKADLGIYYYFHRDMEQAKKWLTAASEQGHTEAQHFLGISYHEQYRLSGDPLDYEMAVHWFTLASEAGDGAAKYYLQNIGAN